MASTLDRRRRRPPRCAAPERMPNFVIKSGYFTLSSTRKMPVFQYHVATMPRRVRHLARCLVSLLVSQSTFTRHRSRHLPSADCAPLPHPRRPPGPPADVPSRRRGGVNGSLLRVPPPRNEPGVFYSAEAMAVSDILNSTQLHHSNFEQSYVRCTVCATPVRMHPRTYFVLRNPVDASRGRAPELSLPRSSG